MRFKKRLNDLETKNGRGLTIFVIDSFEVSGPFVGYAWAGGALYTRRDGESEDDFRHRIERTSPPVPRTGDRSVAL